MKTKLFLTIRSKKGTVISAGETVTVAFDAKTKSGEAYASAFSVNTEDGRRILTRNLAVVGKKTPSLATLERYSDEGIAKTVFGANTEPDGWAGGAPSWLLFMGLI